MNTLSLDPKNENINVLTLPLPSFEQQTIIDYVKENKSNVLVDSVAGAGKTSTILLLAKNVNKNILVLTYNKRLKFETKNKLKIYDIKNCHVFSYHSFCNNIYDRECVNDYGIIQVCRNNIKIKTKMDYDVIIIDEAQDMTKLYYELINKIYRDFYHNNKKQTKHLQICVFGDRYQSIFQFNGADERYIIYSNILLALNPFNWISVSLSTSYRITKQMANTINDLFIGTSQPNRLKLRAVKDIPGSMNYVICNNFIISENSCIVLLIKQILLKYTFDDIFILCPSLKSPNLPARHLSNYLSTLGYPIYLPNSDNDVISDNIIRNKITFSTFHQVKGLERKVVFVYSFDDTFYKYYDKEKYNSLSDSLPSLPNVLYVAITRATEKLYMIHHNSNDFLPFIDKDFINFVNKCDIGEYNEERFYEEINVIKTSGLSKNKETEHSIVTGITDFIKFLPLDLINDFYNTLTIKKLTKSTNKHKIKLDTITTQTNNYVNANANENTKLMQLNLDESVSNITGIAIPLYYEYYSTGKKSLNRLSVCKYISSQRIIQSNETKSYIMERYNKLINSNVSHDGKFFLQLANIYSCLVSNSVNTLNQITNYNWLPDEKLSLIIERIKKVLKVRQHKNRHFEHYLFYDFVDSKNRIVRLNGSIDCLDLNTNTIYEFKCTNELAKEHYIQVAIYHYMYSKIQEKYPWLYVGNIIKISTINEQVKILYYDQNRIHLKKIVSNNNNRNLKITMNLDQKIMDEINELNVNNDLNQLPQVRSCLFNILTNELCEITYDDTKLQHAINLAIDYKYSINKKTQDDVFLQNNLSIKNIYSIN